MFSISEFRSNIHIKNITQDCTSFSRTRWTSLTFLSTRFVRIQRLVLVQLLACFSWTGRIILITSRKHTIGHFAMSFIILWPRCYADHARSPSCCPYVTCEHIAATISPSRITPHLHRSTHLQDCVVNMAPRNANWVM